MKLTAFIEVTIDVGGDRFCSLCQFRCEDTNDWCALYDLGLDSAGFGEVKRCEECLRCFGERDKT